MLPLHPGFEKQKITSVQMNPLLQTVYGLDDEENLTFNTDQMGAGKWQGQLQIQFTEL